MPTPVPKEAHPDKKQLHAQRPRGGPAGSVTFKPEFYVKAYQLARAGLTSIMIAEALGVAHTTLRDWKIRYPAIKQAIDDGRRAAAGLDEEGNFSNYVYDRLPPNLQFLWGKLTEFEDEKVNVFSRIETLLEGQGEQTRKSLFIHALTTFNFNVSRASRAVNISTNTFKTWCEDEEFVALLDEMKFHKKNFFEDALFKLVKHGDTTATVFVNKTVNADRGYNPSIKVVHEGKIEHQHEHISLDVLDSLPLDTKRQLLEAVRKKRLKDQGLDEAPAHPQLTYKAIKETVDEDE